MDSQERHELKQNDLVEAVHHWKDILRNITNSAFIARWGNIILLFIVLLLAAWAVRTWANNRTAAMEDQLWGDLSNATSPEALRDTGDASGDVKVKALAYLRAGDLFLERATQGPVVISEIRSPTAEPVKTTTEPDADARNAEQQYKAVLELRNVNQLVRLNALLGLASAYENLRKWDDAAKTYEQLKTEAGTEYPILVTRANNRLTILPRLKEPVRFAPDAAPADAEAAPSPEASKAPAGLPGLGTPLPESDKPAQAQPEAAQ